MLLLVDWFQQELVYLKNKWNQKALDADNDFISEQEKIETPEPSETQANQ